MEFDQRFGSRRLATGCRAWLFGALCAMNAVAADSAQVDIVGPPGAGDFGVDVKVLPNGNIVVVDRYFEEESQLLTGAVHLYHPDGTLISTLKGNVADVQDASWIGSGGIIVLASGNFLVSSPGWWNGNKQNAGAVTWVSGTKGLSGTVSARNSLVGSTAYDAIGVIGNQSASGVVPLSNGNYVVASAYWKRAGSLGVGAATWCEGNSGCVGEVSDANSLIGTQQGDYVGSSGVTALRNGNYVVGSYDWNNGSISGAGAFTWGDGSVGVRGAVSSANSLVGTTSDEYLGNNITELANGHYVIASPSWDSGSSADLGAVRWCDGMRGCVGGMSIDNALTGSTPGDRVGSRVSALENGHYVVSSPAWDKPGIPNAGAVTWRDGNIPSIEAVSQFNSLTGSRLNNSLGQDSGFANRSIYAVTALSNGDYVVSDSTWSDLSRSRVGAVIWADGKAGRIGVITPEESLIGTTDEDQVGGGGVFALTNGNYVICSPRWNRGSLRDAGAVTWAAGSGGLQGEVSTVNSLTGSNDELLGTKGITALSNGNYVVSSRFGDASLGAVTWADGSAPLIGDVSSVNSLVGSTADDRVGGDGVMALANGNYLVLSALWDNGPIVNAGAATWGDGANGSSGFLTSANSLVGVTTGEALGTNPTVGLSSAIFSDGSYAVINQHWDHGQLADAGAVSLGSSISGVAGHINMANSVRGGATSGGRNLTTAYDAMRSRLVVGRPNENIVTLFTFSQSFFEDGFE